MLQVHILQGQEPSFFPLLFKGKAIFHQGNVEELQKKPMRPALYKLSGSGKAAQTQQVQFLEHVLAQAPVRFTLLMAPWSHEQQSDWLVLPAAPCSSSIVVLLDILQIIMNSVVRLAFASGFLLATCSLDHLLLRAR